MGARQTMKAPDLQCENCGEVIPGEQFSRIITRAIDRGYFTLDEFAGYFLALLDGRVVIDIRGHHAGMKR